MLDWVRRWGWVSIFCLCTAVVYGHGMKQKKGLISEYSFLLQEMEKEKSFVLSQKEDLNLKIASQSDPAWIELVLMRDLGVVPEGWLKIHFQR